MAPKHMIVLVATLGGIFACAEAPKAPAAPCSAAEYRQFDFWLGDWEVRDATGKVVGRNEIASVHNGCVLFESWRGNGGITGMSFNRYDPERKKWRQTWVDSTGGVLELEGVYADGRMLLAGRQGDSMNRVGWQLLPDGRVRQLWETSSDGGTTWKTAFDGYYQKRTP